MIITIFLVLLIIGVVLWLINTYLPLPQGIKTLLNVVAVIGLIIWLLSFLSVIRV